MFAPRYFAPQYFAPRYYSPDYFRRAGEIEKKVVVRDLIDELFEEEPLIEVREEIERIAVKRIEYVAPSEKPDEAIRQIVSQEVDKFIAKKKRRAKRDEQALILLL